MAGLAGVRVDDGLGWDITNLLVHAPAGGECFGGAGVGYCTDVVGGGVGWQGVGK